MSAKLLLATANQKKLVELQRILDAALGASRVTLVGLGDLDDYPDVPETGLTFGENALIKARAGVSRTGLPTVADDSGLAVDALGGMPGVFSARWAGGHGAGHLYLQVERGNTGARGLYGRAGFTELCRYHYRTADGNAGPPAAPSAIPPRVREQQP